MATKTVRELLDDALDAFDDPSISVVALVRKALRIATKRQDYSAQLRLLPETFDLTAGKIDHPAFVEARRSLVVLLGREEGEAEAIRIILRHQRDRSMSTGDKIHAPSVGQLEARLALLNQVYDDYRRPPEGMTPIDTYFVVERHEKAAAQLIPERHELSMVLERIRQSVHDVLLDTERQLETGQRRPTAFQRGQEYVERAAKEQAPAVLTMLAAAEAALDDGEAERLAHALTSCRRAIKALADALYPATGETIVGADGKARVMDDDAYRNRLLQFSIENLGKSAHGRLVSETLESLGNRLERLVELSSKGVHAAVSPDEAEACVMWTYLTVAEVLRIADGVTEDVAGKA